MPIAVYAILISLLCLLIDFIMQIGIKKYIYLFAIEIALIAVFIFKFY